MIPYKDLNPTRTLPIVTILLISVNLAVFLYEMILPEPRVSQFIYQYAVIPLEFKVRHNVSFSPSPFPFFLSVITALFLHGGWLHVIGNMLYLWIFGDNVEERMGSFRFLIFYFLCGILATLAQIYTNPRSEIPALGASGAIAGILAAYLRLFPKARVAVLVPIFYFLRSIVLPAWVVLGLWIFLQIIEVQVSSSAQANATGGIAYFAHMGGFVAGLLLMPLFVKKKRS